MAETLKVATVEEFMRLLVASDVLRSDEIDVARKIAAETHDCRMLARRLLAKQLLTRWQAARLLAGWHQLRLGNYRLRSQIGQGKYGHVFLAEHVQMGREVAIKTLSRRFTQRPDIVERFLEDSREVATLDHRNILHVLDIDQGQDQYFMVMEYVRGRDLQRLVEDDGPLPCPVAADYLRQAAAGLAHAHHLKIHHGDLRPADLLVDEHGGVKLSGFGVARLAEAGQSSDKEDANQDEVGDTAEIQLAGGPRSFDPTADLRALGRTAYFLLTGVVVEDGLGQTGAKALEELRADVPRDLATIVNRLMRARPADGYGTAAEVEETLGRWLASIHPAKRAGGAGTGPEPDLSQPRNAPDAAARVPKGQPTASAAEESATDSSARRFRHRVVLAGGLLLLLGAVAVVSAVLLWPSDARPSLAGGAAVREPRGEQEPPLMRVPRSGTPRTAPTDFSKPVEKKVIPGPTGPADPVGSDAAHSAAEKQGTSPPNPPEKPADASPANAGTAEPKAGAADKPPPEAKESPDTPSPPANPFGELPAAVDLPRLDAAGGAALELQIGPLDVGGGPAVTATLLGGQHAVARGAQFELDPATDPASPQWSLLVQETGSGGTQRQSIATIKLRDGQLEFAWEADAHKNPVAPHLVNCVVRLSSGANTHDLKLRTAVRGDALTVGFKKPTGNARWKLDALPDPKFVRFEILVLEDPFPEAYTLEPAGPIDADEGVVWIKLGKPERQVLAAKITADLSQVFRVEYDCQFQLDPNGKPALLTRREFQNVEQQVTQNQLIAMNRAQHFRAQLLKYRPGSAEHAKANEELAVADRQLQLTAGMLEKFMAAKELLGVLENGAPVQFRLFYLADDCQVVLLRTTEEAAEKEATEETEETEETVE